MLRPGHEHPHFFLELETRAFGGVPLQLGIRRNAVNRGIGQGLVFVLGQRREIGRGIGQQRPFLESRVRLGHLTRRDIAVELAFADFETAVPQEVNGIKLGLKSPHSRTTSLQSSGFIFHRGPRAVERGNSVRGRVLLHPALAFLLGPDKEGEVIGCALFRQFQQVESIRHWKPPSERERTALRLRH